MPSSRNKVRKMPVQARLRQIGDDLTYTFTNCNDGMMTMNGKIMVSNFVLSGTPVTNTPQTWSFSGNFVFDNFQNIMSGKTTSATGNIGGTWRIDADGKQTSSVNLKDFKYTKNNETTTFSNLSMTVVTTKNGLETTNSMSMAGEVSHPRLGSLMVQTETGKELVTASSSPHPTRGSMTMTRSAEGTMKAVSLTITTDAQQLSTKSTTWNKKHQSMTAMSGGSMSGGATTGGNAAGAHATHGS